MRTSKIVLSQGAPVLRSGGSPFACRAALAIVCALLALLAGVGAARASAAEPGPFGVASFDGSVTSQNGTAFTQAGGHPYEASTTIEFNKGEFPGTFGSTYPNRDVKDIRVALPPGLVVNPSATPKCNEAQLEVTGPFNVLYNPTCPVETQVGVVKLNLAFYFGEVTLPVYNVVPPPGHPAQFAFNVLGEAVVHLFPTVRSESDYGITAEIVNSAQSDPFYATTLTLWGVPADSSHDAQRGQNCILGTACQQGGVAVGSPRKPLLSNPTACVGPLSTGLAVDSWANPGAFAEASFLSHDNGTPPSLVGITGCERLAFAPTLSARPTSHAAGTPTGLDIDIHLPQEGLENPSGLATADLKNVVVKLPAGMAVNPASANGLGGCTTGEIGLLGTGFPAPNPIHFNSEAAQCPDSSKIGTVEVDTPLLEHPLTGSVYLASQEANPFDSLLAIYLVAEGQGIRLKLPGHVEAAEGSGQLTATFENNPQLPFEDLHVSFFGGSHASLVTPAACGTYTTQAALSSWGGQSASPSDSFAISEGCSAGSSFGPAFAAGTSSNQAGGFSPFTVTFSRNDGEQALGGLTVKTPPGLLGVLKSVAQCPEPQASQGACGASSLIGHTTVGAGAGSDPFYLGGQVFLTGPYKGAPFGLSIVVPALAGPFNLGNVVVRAQIAVDPHTAALTITSGALPQALRGIPLDLRSVSVTVDRAGFMFNPTSCAPLALSAAITSAQGASSAVSTRFQAAGCAALSFKPKFSVSAQGKTSRRNGASLDVKIASGAGQANIRGVAVALPKQLPSRLTTIQQACPDAVFEANPGSCPAGSLVGSGTATTPILAQSLVGPAYLVSHGGAAFPDLEIVLRGEGITVVLDGSLFIAKNGVTTSTFREVPDVPISSFELKLPTGPHSALAGNLPAKAKNSLCGQSLVMPTTITAQNGAVVKQSTKIVVSGCKAPKPRKSKK
jgi:hypothetical protein